MITDGTKTFELYIGRKSTGFAVVPDVTYPGMFRVRSSDGSLSDMVNMTRAKDAALGHARPRGLGGQEVSSWRLRERPESAPPIR